MVIHASMYICNKLILLVWFVLTQPFWLTVFVVFVHPFLLSLLDGPAMIYTVLVRIREQNLQVFDWSIIAYG